MKQSINSIIDGNGREEGEFEYDWQNFFIKRQEDVDKKTDVILRNEINGLLNKINNENLKNRILETTTSRENKLTYSYYRQGFLDGIQQMLLLNR